MRPADPSPLPSAEAAIDIQDLAFSFGASFSIEALRLQVRRGEVCAKDIQAGLGQGGPAIDTRWSRQSRPSAP